jgi:hypothetical protein
VLVFSLCSIASDLSIPVYGIENLVFGLANMLTLDGGGNGSGKRRANLTLVKNDKVA